MFESIISVPLLGQVSSRVDGFAVLLVGPPPRLQALNTPFAFIAVAGGRGQAADGGEAGCLALPQGL